MLQEENTALIRFQDHDKRPTEVELRNGCRIKISQIVAPNEQYPRDKVTTLDYSYKYGFGNLDDEWLARYDYVPEEAERYAEFEYPTAHVHFNGFSETYEVGLNKELHKLHFPTCRITLEDLIEHLIVEMEVPTKVDKQSTLTILRRSRETFIEEKQARDPYH